MPLSFAAFGSSLGMGEVVGTERMNMAEIFLSVEGLVRYFRLLKNSIMGGDVGAFISAAAEAMMSSTASVTS